MVCSVVLLLAVRKPQSSMVETTLMSVWVEKISGGYCIIKITQCLDSKHKQINLAQSRRSREMNSGESKNNAVKMRPTSAIPASNVRFSSHEVTIPPRRRSWSINNPADIHK